MAEKKDETQQDTGKKVSAECESLIQDADATAAIGATLVAAPATVVEKLKPWKVITNTNEREGWIPCEEYVEALESWVRNRLPRVLTEVIGGEN